jgi:hypothetical protein
VRESANGCGGRGGRGVVWSRRLGILSAQNRRENRDGSQGSERNCNPSQVSYHSRLTGSKRIQVPRLIFRSDLKFHRPCSLCVFIRREIPEPISQHAKFYLCPGATPAGFRTTSSYALSSSGTQNHSAISQSGSSLCSFGGLIHGFVYALGSSMMICNSRVS